MNFPYTSDITFQVFVDRKLHTKMQMHDENVIRPQQRVVNTCKYSVVPIYTILHT